MNDEVAEIIEVLTLRPGADPGTWEGDAPEWFGPVLFGGAVIAQAIAAALKDAPDGRRLHSAHMYFLRPVVAGIPISYRSALIREGRQFTSRHLEASQDGKPTLDFSCSFTTDTDGYVYDLPPVNPVGPPGDAPREQGPGPWEAVHIGATPQRADGTYESTHRMWFRMPPLPDDDLLHTAQLGFASDWTGIGGRPLHLEGDTTGMVSLDHAVWFHRPTRADEWLFYDVQSIVNAGGRGMLRGVMRNQAGEVVLSMAQEMRLTPIQTP